MSTSFESVPAPLYDEVKSLFFATQQLAFALMVRDESDANIVIKNLPPEAEGLTSEKLLRWSDSMRDELSSHREEALKAVINPVFPLMNTSDQFIINILTGINFPGFTSRLIFSAIENICNEVVKNKDIDAKDFNSNYVKSEVLKRGVTYLGTSFPITEELVDRIIENNDVALFIYEMKSNMIFERSKEKDTRAHFLVRLKDGRSTLVRARSVFEAREEGVRIISSSSLEETKNLYDEGEVSVTEITKNQWIEMDFSND